MAVRLSSPFKNLGASELFSEGGQVRFEKVPGPTGPCNPELNHPVIASWSFDFSGLGDGPGFAGAAGWREVRYSPALDPPPFNANRYPYLSLHHMRAGSLQSIRPDFVPVVPPCDDGSTCVGGIYMPANVASNWHVKAIWGNDARIPMTDAPAIFVAAPITQTVPGDTNPNINTLDYFAWRCQRSVTVPATYEFILTRVSTGSLSTNMGLNFSTTAFGVGHEFSLRVVCNNEPNEFGVNTTQVDGLVDGIVRRTATFAAAGNKPAGRPGVGLLIEQLLQPATAPAYIDSFCSVVSWSADQLL